MDSVSWEAGLSDVNEKGMPLTEFRKHMDTDHSYAQRSRPFEYFYKNLIDLDRRNYRLCFDNFKLGTSFIAIRGRACLVNQQ